MKLLISKKKRKHHQGFEDEEQICSQLRRLPKQNVSSKRKIRMTKNQIRVSLTTRSWFNPEPAHRDAHTYFATEWSKTGRAKVSSVPRSNSKLAPSALMKSLWKLKPDSTRVNISTASLA